MMYFPEDRINAMVQRAKRKLIVSPTIGGAGVGSTASQQVGRIPLSGDSFNPGQREQRSRTGDHLALRLPAQDPQLTAQLRGSNAGNPYRQQQAQQASQQQQAMQQAIVNQIQNEDAANRMTSDEANARALELRNFFQR